MPWTKPEDIPFGPQPLWPHVGGLFPDGFHGVMADGKVRFFPKSFTEAQLHHTITYNDGNVVPLP